MDKGIDDCDNAIEDLYSVKFDKANIANNLITTASGLALDARQGTALKALIDAQNDNLASYFKSQTGSIDGTVNWNYIGTGAYQVLDTSGANAPALYQYGALIVFAMGIAIIQVYFPHLSTSYPQYRVCFNGAWLDWKGMA
jgi:hypothetical protein